MTAPDPVATPDPTLEAPNPTPQGAPVAPDPVEPPKSSAARRSLEDSLADLDPDTREYVLGEVSRARNEAKNLRARVKDPDKVAEAARVEMAQQVAKALGLVQDETTTDPAALTEQLTTEREKARQASVELAVYRAALATDADAGALLDSRRFMDSLSALDPTDADAVSAAVAAAVEANAALKATPARRLPGANPAQGSSASGSPSLDAQIAEAKKVGNTALWMHLENQKLTTAGRQ